VKTISFYLEQFHRYRLLKMYIFWPTLYNGFEFDRTQGVTDLYIGWQWRNFFIPYLCPPWCGTSSEKCLLLWHHFLNEIVIIRKIFLNQLIRFVRITQQISTT